MKKDQIIMTVIIGLVCIVFFSVMFMQFKTIEETDITAIENMRETELRAAISEWKGKFEETQTLLEENQKSIQEYQDKIEKNEETSELVEKDLVDSNMKLGKTAVVGEGITLNITDSDMSPIKAYDLLYLVNELRYAGAEAISINGVRVLSTTYISEPQEGLVLIDGSRITSPFVVKAIGNQTYLSSTLSLKDTGFIDKYTASGVQIQLETGKNIQIPKYNGKTQIKYMKKVEE